MANQTGITMAGSRAVGASAGVRCTTPLQAGLATAAAVLLHRALLWHLYGDLLDAAARNNPTWLTWQYLPVSAYRDHFLAALWHLQQTPPLPHALLGAVLAAADWPVGVARALYGLHALVSAGTALILVLLLHRLRCNLAVGVGVALLFGMSTDLLLIEVNSLGQLIYETGAMLLVAAACLCLVGLPQGAAATRNRLLAAGLLVALAALTRASFSYLFAILGAILLLIRGPRRAAWFLLPVLLLQGGWSLKTYVAYGNVTVATSSWAGINATVGLGYDPAVRQRFVASVTADENRYPVWFVGLLRRHGYVHWHTLPADVVPSEAVAHREADIQRELGGANPRANSITIRQLSDQYMKAYARFALHEPAVVAAKTARAYGLFWQPIGDYSAMYLGPLFVEPTGRHRLFSLRPIRPEHAYATTGTFPDKRPVPVWLPTVPLHLVDTLCIVVLHLLLPLVLLVDARAVLRRGPTVLTADLLLVLAVAVYGAVLFNLVELGENMRFRIAVMPEILAVSFALLCRLVRVGRAALGVTRATV